MINKVFAFFATFALDCWWNRMISACQNYQEANVHRSRENGEYVRHRGACTNALINSFVSVSTFACAFFPSSVVEAPTYCVYIYSNLDIVLCRDKGPRAVSAARGAK